MGFIDDLKQGLPGVRFAIPDGWKLQEQQDRRVVLLDEPFTGVDVKNRAVFHDAIREFAARGITVLIATHDLDEVHETTDMVMCLNRRMVAFGPTRSTYTPANLRATFGGQVAVFEEAK